MVTFSRDYAKNAGMWIESRDVAGGVRILTLNRPPANAINGEVLDDLARACDEAERDDAVRAVVFTGSGKFFSGGLDLAQLSADPAQRAKVMGFGKDDGVFALWRLPKPTIAMVNGHAIAGGGILLLACDFRIAARTNLKIGLNEVALGLAFPIGAFEISRLALTNRQARRVLLEAGLYPLDTARELGFLDEVVEPDELESTCFERAALLGSYPRAAYAHTKRALQQQAHERVRSETADEHAAIHAVWNSDETLRTVTAQLAGIRRK
ncbi:MAG: enoyl-CoA hydratase/isomerase family protein [Candidatus Rokubacteria bacterium]|nr:enoyl-CoA hydratase/isomerase family protein [Candidatus Rokubacteria bacterium]